MPMVRWEPFHNLVSMQDRMNRIFEDAFRGQRGGTEDDWALGGTWAPAVGRPLGLAEVVEVVGPSADAEFG